MKNYLVKVIIHSIWICFACISINTNAQDNYTANGYCNINVGNQASVMTITNEIMVMPVLELGGFADLSDLANSIGAAVIHTYQMGLEH